MEMGEADGLDHGLSEECSFTSWEVRSRWAGSKQGLEDTIGVSKDRLDPGVLAGPAEEPRGSVPLLRGKDALQPENQGGQLPEVKSPSRAWVQGSGPEAPSQALPQPRQHPRVLQKTSLARCLGPHSLIILMPKCIKEAWWKCYSNCFLPRPLGGN